MWNAQCPIEIFVRSLYDSMTAWFMPFNLSSFGSPTHPTALISTVG